MNRIVRVPGLDEADVTDLTFTLAVRHPGEVIIVRVRAEEAEELAHAIVSFWQGFLCDDPPAVAFRLAIVPCKDAAFAEIRLRYDGPREYV